MNGAGFNPMRWDCNKGGPGVNCFNKKRRPKIEVFSKCFPGKISLGDIDGIVEINWRGLLLEWKTDTNKPTTGQRIMYERLTSQGLLTVVFVVGNAETMEVSHVGTFFLGKQSALEKASLQDVELRMQRWCCWAQSLPPLKPLTKEERDALTKRR